MNVECLRIKSKTMLRAHEQLQVSLKSCVDFGNEHFQQAVDIIQVGPEMTKYI